MQHCAFPDHAAMRDKVALRAELRRPRRPGRSRPLLSRNENSAPSQVGHVAIAIRHRTTFLTLRQLRDEGVTISPKICFYTDTRNAVKLKSHDTVTIACDVAKPPLSLCNTSVFAVFPRVVEMLPPRYGHNCSMPAERAQKPLRCRHILILQQILKQSPARSAHHE